MGKGKKGRGGRGQGSTGQAKGRKREAITRRDVSAKRSRKEERRASERPAPIAGTPRTPGDDEEPDEPEDAVDAEEPEAQEDAPESEKPPAEKKAGEPDDAPSGLVTEIAEYHSGLPDGAAWALPLVRLDHRWTWLETRMLLVVLCVLGGILCFWFSMKAMGEAVASPVAAGTVFRGLVGAAVLGGLSRVATRGRMPESRRTWVTIGAILAGLAVAKLWRGVGIEFFSGLLDWLQKGSVLALFGGLKGVTTRLTMLLALIGGSLAASAGTHIAIDVLVRLISKRVRRPVAVGSAAATALVCLLTSWGFFDHVAVTALGARADASASEKVAAVGKKLGEHFFVLRKQIKFDIGALPYVLTGEPWNDPERFKGKDWNAFIDSEGFVERYGEEKVQRIRARDSALEESYQPFVNVPDERTDGMLRDGLDLIWPLGFFMLALRFLLRALLVLAGHVRAEVEGEAE